MMVKVSGVNAQPRLAELGPGTSLVPVLRDGRMGPNDRALVEKRAGADFARVLKEARLRPGEVPIHTIALGATEHYGCFVAGSRVRMGDANAKPIEEVLLGDRVVDRFGTPGKVITRYVRPYAGPGTKLVVSGMLRDTTCTSNHSFWVIPREQVQCSIDKAKHCKPGTCQQLAICRERNCSRTTVRFDPRWVSAGELHPGDYLLCPIPDRGVGKQTWTWSIPFARLLGYFLSEGCYLKRKQGEGKAKNGIRCYFNANEEETLGADLVAQVAGLREEYPEIYVRGPYQAGENCIAYDVVSPAVASRFHRIVGEYANQKYLSGEAYSQPPDRIANMIATYIDGDGTCPIYERTNCDGTEARYSMHTASERLADDLQWLLTKLGVAATVCEVKALAVKYNGERQGFRTSLTNEAGQFLKGLACKYRDVPPAQQKEWSFVWNGHVCRPVREVTHFELDCPVYNLEVEGDHTYTIETAAVKNCNRNGDGFKDAVLQKRAHTFETHARFYRNHANKDPKKSYGRIVKAAYVPALRRVDLLVALNGDAKAAEANGGLVADKEMEKLASGAEIPTSMACIELWDECSGCGNIARNRSEYCDGFGQCKYGGLKRNITATFEDGHQLHADNPDNLTWFDESHVYKPADRIAYTLGLVDGGEKQAGWHRPLGGAALAEELGVEAPLALLLDPALPRRAAAQAKLAHALADLERAGGRDTWALAFGDAPPVRELPDVRAHEAQLGRALRALATEKVALPVRDFLALVLGPREAAECADAVQAQLPGVFGRLAKEASLADDLRHAPYNPADEVPPTRLRLWAASLVADHGLGRKEAEARVARAALRGRPARPARALDAEGIKEAADRGGAEKLAREYAKYQLAFLGAAEERDPGSVPLLATLLVRSNAAG